MLAGYITPATSSSGARPTDRSPRCCGGSVVLCRESRESLAQVLALHVAEGPVGDESSCLQQQRPGAEPLEHRVIVAGGDHDAAGGQQLTRVFLGVIAKLVIK